MTLKREDMFHVFPEDVSRSDIVGLLKHYDRKGVTKYYFTYKGQRIDSFKLVFISEKDTVEIQLN